MIGGIMNKPPEMANVRPNWQIYFRVPDITAAIERINRKANGGQILNGPMEVPGGDWIVNAMDPQGSLFMRRKHNNLYGKGWIAASTSCSTHRIGN
jgi:uncharacterized protein